VAIGRESWGDGQQIGPRALAHGPSDGVADSLNKAKAAFRAAWGSL